MIRSRRLASAVGLCLALGCGDSGGGDDGTTGGSTSQGPSTGPTASGVDGSGTTGTGSSSGTAGVGCGDGMTEGDEVCDDGNRDDGDGCSADCSAATCLVPVTHATVQAGEDDADCPTVWLMPGTYTENVVVDRDAIFEQVPLGDVILDGDAAGSTVGITAGSVTLRGIIVANGLADQGGGIRAESPLTLEGSTVRMNAAQRAGGGIYTASDLTLDASHVVSNTLSAADVAGTDAGGGIYMTGGTLLVTNASTVSQNTISEQGPTDGYGRGGGLYAIDAEVTIEGASEVDGNTVVIEGAGEFQVAQGAGLYLDSTDVALDGASITNNVATATATDASVALVTAGGIYTFGGDVTMTSGAAISGNQAVARSSVNATAAAGGINLAGAGSSLSATSSTLADNVAEAHGEGGNSPVAVTSGGAVSAAGGSTDVKALVLNATAITGNTARAVGEGTVNAFARGGALFIQAGGDGGAAGVDLVGCTITGNAADSAGSASGGAVYANAIVGDAATRVTFDSSTASGNTATAADGPAEGGVVYARAGSTDAGTVIGLVNSTFSGNTADGTPSRGGALYVRTSFSVDPSVTRLVLASSTITLNEAVGGNGGGVGALEGVPPEVVVVNAANTIIYGNVATTAPDCETLNGADFDSGGYNLFGDTTGCAITGTTTGNLVGMDPMLGPLMDNSGPTRTHALPMASVAVDAGDPAGCTVLGVGVLSDDQRGMGRASGGRCDIGAFELQQ